MKPELFSPEWWEAYWKSDAVDAHRRGINDMKWASMQPMEPPVYVVGDVVEFMVGGIGIVTDVSPTNRDSGWPNKYAAEPVPGHPFHAKGVWAWHYEGDIRRLVEGSALRKLHH